MRKFTQIAAGIKIKVMPFKDNQEFFLINIKNINISSGCFEKTADISRRYHWFSRQITSDERAQKFHPDDVSLPRSG